MPIKSSAWEAVVAVAKIKKYTLQLQELVFWCNE
jgi:hypothetical protein